MNLSVRLSRYFAPGDSYAYSRPILSDARGGSLEVVGRPTFEFSALHLSDDDLFHATHTTDLTPRREIFLNIDGAHRGLGTLSCGPDTLDRYRLLEREYRFAFSLHATMTAPSLTS